jgi:hypothetical protein
MKIFLALVAALALAGCSTTNIAEVLKAMGENPNAHCIIINAGPYGGATIAKGSPDVSVQVSASGCSMEGAHVTKVTVPVGSISVVPVIPPK